MGRDSIGESLRGMVRGSVGARLRGIGSVGARLRGMGKANDAKSSLRVIKETKQKMIKTFEIF